MKCQLDEFSNSKDKKSEIKLQKRVKKLKAV